MRARWSWKKLVLAAGITGWFGFNAVMGFYTYLWRNSPDAPDFGRGLIMPMHQQARTFYVVPFEQRVVLIGLALSLLLVVGALVSGVAFFRADLKTARGLSWLNVTAVAAFVVLAAYAAWPM